ncbi:DUF6878 family protein [Zavarzinia sp.]|uniref:DUF6878 family protein n=1 Tax=Zavarzinia sp. TaxID=2027920 RepID=UPI003BB69DD4
MTTLEQNPAQDPGADDWLARYNARTAAEAALRATNKNIVFDALAAAGITTIVITFDGYGDSGQIEDIEVRGPDGIDLNRIKIRLTVLDWRTETPEEREASLHECVEDLAYGFLNQTHCGWENNEGGYGEFTFDVAKGTVSLDYNERYEAVETYQHQF